MNYTNDDNTLLDSLSLNAFIVLSIHTKRDTSICVFAFFLAYAHLVNPSVKYACLLDCLFRKVIKILNTAPRWTFFTVDILTCHSSKSTGRTDNNNGSIP